MALPDDDAIVEDEDQRPDRRRETKRPTRLWNVAPLEHHEKPLIVGAHVVGVQRSLQHR
jgi:hypothetical protein